MIKKARFELTLICARTQLSTILIIFVMNQLAGVESLGTDTSTRLKEPYVGAAELKDKTCFVCRSGSLFAVQRPLEDIYTFITEF